MELVWRRTVTSVFLLLCLQNARVLCQNVPFNARPSPVLKESVGEVCNTGPVLQQKGLCPSGGVQPSKTTQPQLANLPAEVSRAPFNVGSQRVLENPGQIRPIANVGQFPSRVNVQPTNCQPTPGPASNTVTNTNIPQEELPKSTQKCLPTNPLFNPSVTRSYTTQGVSSVPMTSQTSVVQNPNCSPSVMPNVRQPIAPPVPNQAVPCPQNCKPQNIFPAGFQNQYLQSPLAVNPYAQSLGPNTPCLTTDLTSVKVLPTPNLPPIPVQNCASTPQVPIQQVTYPQPFAPVEYIPNTPYLPNYQVSNLPPVYPSTPIYDCFRNPVPVTEEYTPVPINLSINVPAPTIPEPKITIITAYPQIPVPASTSTENSDLFGLFPSYPLPPIIIEGRRSRSRSWLPLILIALIADDFGGNCCCCCPEPPTPVPYPIAIPTNNPIILNNKSRKKGSKLKTSIKTNTVNN